MRIKQTSGEGLPLEANAKERHFKTIFLDIGLMQNMCGLSSEILFSTDESFMKVNEGAVAEQFTAQELLAYRDYYLSPALFYWAREARNSCAEIDYLILCDKKDISLSGESAMNRAKKTSKDLYI